MSESPRRPAAQVRAELVETYEKLRAVKEATLALRARATALQAELREAQAAARKRRRAGGPDVNRDVGGEG